MLPQKQIKKMMKKLGVKKEKNAVYFLSRLEGWIKHNGNTTISLLKGINTILENIHQEEIKEAQKLKKINLKDVKNNLIEKHVDEIIDLYLIKGYGTRKISQILWENHRAKLSYSAIYRFLNSQNLIRKKGDGDG